MLDTPRSVREITDHIRDLFDADPLLGDVWISGEVLESTVSRSGHVFFTLAGDGAQIRCVLFRMNALRQRSLPSSGSACVAHGRVEIYAGDEAVQRVEDGRIVIEVVPGRHRRSLAGSLKTKVGHRPADESWEALRRAAWEIADPDRSE